MLQLSFIAWYWHFGKTPSILQYYFSSLSTMSGNNLELGWYQSLRWRSHISYTMVNKDMPLIKLLRYDMAYDLCMVALVLSPFFLIKFGYI